MIIQHATLVFPLNFLLIGKWPDFFKKIVTKAVKIGLRILNFAPIPYLSMLKVILSQSF